MHRVTYCIYRPRSRSVLIVEVYPEINDKRQYHKNGEGSRRVIGLAVHPEVPDDRGLRELDIRVLASEPVHQLVHGGEVLLFYPDGGVAASFIAREQRLVPGKSFRWKFRQLTVATFTLGIAPRTRTFISSEVTYIYSISSYARTTPDF